MSRIVNTELERNGDFFAGGAVGAKLRRNKREITEARNYQLSYRTECGQGRAFDTNTLRIDKKIRLCSHIEPKSIEQQQRGRSSGKHLFSPAS